MAFGIVLVIGKYLLAKPASVMIAFFTVFIVLLKTKL
jgi:hypothetical protein